MPFEYAILDWIQANLRSPLMDAVMVAITHLGDGGVLFMLLGVWLLLKPATRNTGIALLFSLTIAILCCSGLLKPLFARARPFAGREGMALLVSAPTDFSFPSGHTAAAELFFCRNRWCLPVGVLALLIGFSRMYLYVHFPTDVLCGCVLGILVGWMTCRILRSDDQLLPCR